MMDPSAFRFHYDARIYNVVDGDTVDAELDLGFRLSWRQRFRLYGIDTPELNSPDSEQRMRALAAKAYVEATTLGQPTIFRTHLDKADKFGRWLAVVHYLHGDVWRSLNDELLAQGWATRYP